MDIERMFLNKVALSGQIENSIHSGIKDSHFADERFQDIYRYLTEHVRKYKGPPSLAVLQERFPDHNFEVPTDSFDFLRERFVRDVKKRIAASSLIALGERLDDPSVIDDFEGIFLEEARTLTNLFPTSSVVRFSDMDKRIEKYEAGGVAELGVKMGIPEFDRITLGIQPHELVSIVGWQGMGKSTLTQWILFNAWMQGKTVMIIPLEMDGESLMRKWDTMFTNFEYLKLKAGELDPLDVERWKIKAQMVKEKKCDIIVRDDVSDCTVEFVYAEIMRYKPDVIAIDYVSLMDYSRLPGRQMWEKLTSLTRQLKQIARSSKTPIIAVAQTNIASSEGGAKLDNIAYTRSIGMDSDIVLGLHQDEEMKEEKQMTVRMLKNRDGAQCAVDLYWNMDRMEFQPWNEWQAFKNRMKRKEIVENET